jgi:hypothetical protein
MTTTRDEQFFRTMRRRFKQAEEAIQTIHEEALQDWKFRLGDQWDPKIEAARKADGRPCKTINRLPQFLRRVSGEQRKNRPGIEVSPVGDGADVETAEIIQGLVRHVQRISDAEEAFDTAFDHMLTAGFGYIRLIADYIDDSFDQEIKFEPEKNPFAHYPDPRCKRKDYSDARFWFVLDYMDHDEFREEFSESELAQLSDFSSKADEAPDWIKRDSVRVAEYFWVESVKETIKKGKRTRTKEKRIVHWCLTNGIEILEETIIPGEFIPILAVLGEDITVDGQRYLIGLIRYARTPQELYNLWQSAMAEAIALAPKAPYMVTTKQVEGFEHLYEQSNSVNLPYLPYNADEKAPGPPQRNNVEAPIEAITVAIQHADNDLHSTTGLYDASLGAPGPEQSGKAILLRQKQGDSATFAFQDALPTALKHAGRIILQWIPVYYDAERVVRIVNPDGTSKTVPINQPYQNDQGFIRVFDLTVGRYDVAIGTGPSYDSMREEAAQSILQLVQAQPELMNVVGDLLVACFDWPMAKEISERLKKMLPPQLQDQQEANPQILATKLQHSQQMIEQLTAAVHKLSAQAEGKQIEAASRERIALINARAGIVEAILKTQSAEAMRAFELEVEQIDRQLALIPDPAIDPATGQPQAAPQPQQPAQQPQQAAQQPMPLAA